MPSEYEDDDGIKQDQISTYCKFQKNKEEYYDTHSYVVMVSNYKIPGYSKNEKQLDHYLGNFTWQDVANVIKNHIKETINDNVLVKLEEEFLFFMKEENMAFEDFKIAELSSIAFYKRFEGKRDALINRIQGNISDNVFSKYRLKKFPAWGKGELDTFYGLIFHNAKGTGVNDVASDGSFWIAAGLFINEDMDWFPKSSDTSIPDVYCCTCKWFDSAKQLQEFANRKDIKLLLKTFEPHYEIIKFTAENNNYLAIMKSASLLDFILKENQDQEILNYIQKGMDVFIKTDLSSFIKK